MKMKDWFKQKLVLHGDCIEDDHFHYANMSCEYLVDGVDAGEAICHAVNNHDELVAALENIRTVLGVKQSLTKHEAQAIFDNIDDLLKNMGEL